MKSRIRNAIPKKIIGINISSQKRDIIEDIAKSENAEAVFFDNEIMGQQVGYLCGFKGFVRSEKEGEDITDECLIFSGINGRSLDPILKKLREKEATVKLKAKDLFQKFCGVVFRYRSAKEKSHTLSH